MVNETKFNEKIIGLLKNNGIGIIPTDTIYGIVGLALSPKAVQKIYKTRKRDLRKPMIILISKLSDIGLFGINIDAPTRKMMNKLWPGKVSIVVSSDSNKFKYLKRSGKTLAFRLPRPKKLRDLISRTGPLVAPSANPEGLPPAANIKEARKYFGNLVDFYVDAGGLKSKPSKIVAIENGKVIIKRK